MTKGSHTRGCTTAVEKREALARAAIAAWPTIADNWRAPMRSAAWNGAVEQAIVARRGCHVCASIREWLVTEEHVGR